MILAGVIILNSHVAKGAEKEVKMDVDTLYASFEDRRDAVFESYRGRKVEIADKRSPLSGGRPKYTRHYARSVLELAITSMMNNENLDRANEELAKYAEYYRDNRAARNDRDSFYWTTDVMTRIVEFFGQDGSVAAGRLDPEVEDKLLELMWVYVKENSYVGEAETFDNLSYPATQPLSADYQEHKSWFMRMSENHHTQKFTTLWHFSKLLSESPEYRNRSYDDGNTAQEHYRAWTEYAKVYLRERARRGMFVEMANGCYNVHTLKGIYNLHDFSADKQFRKLAGNFLTLYYVLWAQEQINGVRGGGKSRIYPKWFKNGRSKIKELREWMWFYLDIGEQPDFGKNQATVATSSYRMPKVVMDLALDLEGRGSFEIRNRKPGLNTDEKYHQNPWVFRRDFGGRLRYTYTTPDFVMGLPVMKPVPAQKWAAIGIYDLLMGAIFRGGIDDRIIPYSTGRVNSQWGVQRKGTMITQRHVPPYSRKSGARMRVWFGGDGFSNGVKRDGWLFVETKGAYAAVRPAKGGFALQSDVDSIADTWMDIENDDSPVVIEVARKKWFDSYEAFQNAILKLAWEWRKGTLHYKGLYGNEFVFYAEDKKLPEVDGKTVDLAPEKVYDSPFVQSEWNSGVVAISKGDRKLVLDFH